LPVILCTAYPSVRENFSSIAPDDYVLKSSDLSELKLRIGKALDDRKKVVFFDGQGHREEVKRILT
jgi:hypothetical protein